MSGYSYGPDVELFVSDIHLGRGPLEEERRHEAALISCLRFHQEDLEHVYLVGDVFDEYIEYRHLVPKGGVRLLACLAELVEAGIRVTYLHGNHDPWHRDYLTRAFGIEVAAGPIRTNAYGFDLHIEHGDGLRPGSLGRVLKPVLRHPVPVWIYRTMLPADFGFRLARWYNRTFGHGEIDPLTTVHLRQHAAEVIDSGKASLVVMAHSHQAELLPVGAGAYLNTGYWRDERTYGVLTADGIHLQRWNGTCSVLVTVFPKPAPRQTQCSEIN